VILEDKEAAKSPFKKVFEKEVMKFKQVTPAAEKHSCGIGKLSILEAKIGSSILYKLVFKNNIGKILYDANISGKFSKHRKIEEKAYKNQLKLAVCKLNAESKKQAL